MLRQMVAAANLIAPDQIGVFRLQLCRGHDALAQNLGARAGCRALQKRQSALADRQSTPIHDELAAICELGLPVKLVGLGETIGDLVPFDPAEFVAALVSLD